MNSIFVYNHANSGQGHSLPTRCWCPYEALLLHLALCFSHCNGNAWLYKTKSIQYDKLTFFWRLRFLSSSHSKCLLKDVALTVQEKSCICLENKDIMRATRPASLKCLFDILGHDLSGLLCEKIHVFIYSCSFPVLQVQITSNGNSYDGASYKSSL